MSEANTAEKVLGAVAELAVFTVGEGAAVEEKFRVVGLGDSVAFIAEFAGDSCHCTVVQVVALYSAKFTVLTVLKLDAVEAGLAVFAVLVVVAGAVFISCAVFEKFWGFAGEVVEALAIFFYQSCGEGLDFGFCEAGFVPFFC